MNARVQGCCQQDQQEKEEQEQKLPNWLDWHHCHTDESPHWHQTETLPNCHTDQLTKCYDDTLHCDLWLIKVGGMEAMHRSTQHARILSVSLRVQLKHWTMNWVEFLVALICVT